MLSQTVGFNIGDQIQMCALQKLYQEMNIEETEIVYINFCDLSAYDGEYVLLPMLGIELGIGYSSLPLSSKIIPIFVSSHFVANDLIEKRPNMEIGIIIY